MRYSCRWCGQDEERCVCGDLEGLENDRVVESDEREKGDDDGREYADPRDARDERLEDR